MKRHVTIAACLVLGFTSLVNASDQLVVHEWGTFTSFQNEIGESLRRINTDDEPVPSFVHQLKGMRLFSPTDLIIDEPQQQETQGAPTASPQVTMRLETPVIYFHLPKREKLLALDVTVEFRGGFLTQFFPNAVAMVDHQPIEKRQQIQFPIAQDAHIGSLHWKNIVIGKSGVPPETSEHVWIAPRQVSAAPLTVDNESEKFLFYRGVGEVTAPLRVIRHADQVLDVRFNDTPRPSLDSLSGGEHVSTSDKRAKSLRLLNDKAIWSTVTALRQVWFLDVHADGTSAYQRLPISGKEDRSTESFFFASSNLPEAAFSKENLALLRSEMREELVADGLFQDEADALLNTWELSYFLSPGQRLFFLVPREWTDAVLPLKLSVPAEVTRVMVGRIELVTPRQRELLKKIADTPVPDLTEVVKRMRELKTDPSRRDQYNALASGRGDSSILGISVPPTYLAFLDLGRFRTSLLMDAAERDRKTATTKLNGLNYLRFEVLFPGKLPRE